MGVSTLTHPAQHAVTEEAKASQSGFGQRLRGWRERRTERTTPDELLEHIDTQARWITERVKADLRGELGKAVDYLVAKQQGPARPARGEAALYNVHPQPLLRLLSHLAVDLEADQTLGARDCYAALHAFVEGDLRKAALEEGEAEQTWKRRTGESKHAAEAKGQRLTVAAQDEGEDAQLKTATVVVDGEEREYLPGTASRIVSSALRASDPRSTALLEPLTEAKLAEIDAAIGAQTQVLPVVEQAPASTAPSPVHVPGEDLRPAIPENDEDADPGAYSPLAVAALPRRVKVTSFPARMSAEPGVPLDGAPYDATQLLVMPGAWMLTGMVWSLVQSAVVDATAERVIVDASVNSDMSLAADEPVWLLSPAQAAQLVEPHRSELAQLEAAR